MEKVQSSDPETARTLNFIAGALLFHAAANGRNSLAGRLDAEELFRAVTVLETRDQAELAAFVSSFHPQIALAGPDQLLLPPHAHVEPRRR